MKRGVLFAGIATLAGTMIGAGILGLPYAISKSGFLVGLLFILFLGLINLNMHLYLGEVALRTKGYHQLTGYAEKYLGKTGKYIMLFSAMFGIYSALIAYLIAEGQSLSFIFFGNTNASFYLTILFFIFACFFVFLGLNAIKKGVSIGVISLIAIVVLIALFFIPKINLDNLAYTSSDFNDLIFPYGVVFFAMLGYSALPELEQELKNNEKLMKKAIIWGTLIPILVYILFTFVILGFMGKSTPEIATFSLGKLPTILGVIGMLNAFIILSTALKDTYHLDLKINKILAFALTCFVPLIIFLIVYLFNFVSFVRFIELSGGISGGITGILALFMLYKAKKEGNRKPEYSMPLPMWIMIFLTILFVLGIIYVLVI